MLIVETIQPTEPGGWVLTRAYSDAGFMIRQDGTGDLYSEAIDPEFTNRTYTETNIPIEESEDEVEAKAEAYDILLGVNE